MTHQSNCCQTALIDLSLNGKGSCTNCGLSSTPMIDLRNPMEFNPFFIMLFILLFRVRYNNIFSIIYSIHF